MPHILITGASHGIGAETARIAKADGWQVTALDLDEPRENCDHYVQLDLSDCQSIETAVKEVAAFGPFDALANIAGVPPRDGPVTPPLMINFLGLRHFTERVINQMNPDASIVNLASRAGAAWRRNLEQVKKLVDLAIDDDLDAFCADEDINAVRAYDLSKEAVIVWTMMQCEPMVKRGLRVNSVSPAIIATRIQPDFEVAYGAGMASAVERAGRAGKPEEVAELVMFLASPKSNWLKGLDIWVDGGMAAMVAADRL